MVIKISKNKRLIIEACWDKADDRWERWFSVTAAFSRKVDNAGFDFFMDIARFYFRFSINDKRFWDCRPNSSRTRILKSCFNNTNRTYF